MRFPNAAKGIKKIFTAEILQIIASACAIFGIVVLISGGALALVQDNSDTALASFLSGAALAVVFLIAFIVLLIIAFIMNLVGTINASHDEQNYKTALICLLISIGCSVVSGIFMAKNATVGGLFQSFSSLFNTISIIFVIAGSVKLADQLNRGDVSKLGSNIFKIILVIGVLSLVATIIASFMATNIASIVTVLVLFVVGLILSAVEYIMYVVFLGKAKKMLAEA